MKKWIAIPLAFTIASLAASGNTVSEKQSKWVAQYKKQQNYPKDVSKILLNTDKEPALTEGFTSLYNGKNLDGWVLKGGAQQFEAKGEAIVGTCVPKTASGYLSTVKDDYEDFIFTAEMKWEVDGNTGIMFRAKAEEKKGKKGTSVVVSGPQVEMEDYGKKRFWSGGIYGQSCGGYWYPLILEEHAAAQQAMKPMGEWNRVTIHAQGDVVKTWLNGVPVAHFKWEKNDFKKGFFGLQIHSGSKGKVHFRGMKVKEL